jgi:hypothetical protein
VRDIPSLALKMNFLLLFCFLAIASLVFSQFDEDAAPEPVPNQSQQVMNQEIIEALWNLLSPGCKSEMEAALGTKSDISAACKAEVQSGLISLNVIPDPSMQQAEGQNPNSQQQQQAKQPKAEAILETDQTGKTNAILAIAGFVVFLFCAAAVYVAYANKAAAAAGDLKKPKKLSKKKVILFLPVGFF